MSYESNAALTCSGRHLLIVDFPGELTSQQIDHIVRSLRETKNRQHHNDNHLYFIKRPKLRVDDIDNLYSHLDKFKKLIDYIRLLQKKLLELYCKYVFSEKKINQSINKEIEFQRFEISDFMWNNDQYDSHMPLDALEKMLSNKTMDIAGELDNIEARLNTAQNNLEKIIRSENSDIISRDPTFLISDDDLVNTMFLSTIIIIVPEKHNNQFLYKFDNENYGIVPRSLMLLEQDSKHYAYSLKLLSKFKDDYTSYLQDLKCIVKNTTHGYESASDFWEKKSECQVILSTNIDVLKSYYIICCRDIFQLLFHINILIIHIKSVLKFGRITNAQRLTIIQLDQNTANNDTNSFSNIYHCFIQIGNQIVLKAGQISPTSSKHSLNINQMSMSSALIDSENHDAPFNIQLMVV